MSRGRSTYRVVILLQELKFGGSQTQALELARGLAAAGLQVQVWSLMAGQDLLPRARHFGLRVRQLGRAGYVWPPALARLAQALRQERPEVLLLYTGIPNIWGRLLGRLYKVPVIVGTCRGSLEPGRQRDRWLWRLAHHHICNAGFLKEMLVEQAGVNPAAISVIPNGVDLERFRTVANQRGPAPVVLCLGRLSPEKGQAVLLEAFSKVAVRHQQAQLWLVGDGPQRESLARRARATICRERIRLLPASQDVPGLLGQATLLALPSRHEGMPNVILEAMAAGLPVLASDLGGVSELVEPEQTGLLLPPGDVEAWAAGLDRLLSEPGLGRAWGRAGRQRVEERFSLAAMIQAHRELLDCLLSRREG